MQMILSPLLTYADKLEVESIFYYLDDMLSVA